MKPFFLLVFQEAVQRLFRTVTPEDEFTQWCENVLKGMATSVDGQLDTQQA